MLSQVLERISGATPLGSKRADVLMLVPAGPVERSACGSGVAVRLPSGSHERVEVRRGPGGVSAVVGVCSHISQIQHTTKQQAVGTSGACWVNGIASPPPARTHTAGALLRAAQAVRPPHCRQHPGAPAAGGAVCSHLYSAA